MAIVTLTASAFSPQTKCIKEFLNGNELGFYIPLYQREYSWTKENITQLETDIEDGLERLIDNPSEEEVRFLGTIITIRLSNTLKSLPGQTYIIVDGQQRLTTISILSTLILQKLQSVVDGLDKICRKPGSSLNMTEINAAFNLWKSRLTKAFATEIGMKLVPKIIREENDSWDHLPPYGTYKSPLASYLFDFISKIGTTTFTTAKFSFADLVLRNNISELNLWIDRICTAHQKCLKLSADKFLSKGVGISGGTGSITNLQTVVSNYSSSSKKNSEEDLACQFVQLLSVCNYLFEACCFTIIECQKEGWAFDLFQSLNTTGTPLTVIETFKPVVVNTMNASASPIKYPGSIPEEGFKNIDMLLGGIRNAEKKNKFTQAFVTSFFISYDGSSVSSLFSIQMKALVKAYNSIGTSFGTNEQIDFIQYLGHYALFYKIWENPEPTEFHFLTGKLENDLIQMLILFLKASNHKMAITVLGRFYHEILLETPSTPAYNTAVDEFISVVKIVASFYFFWRSAFNNSGLDEVYRDFFATNQFFPKKKITSCDVKNYFQAKIINKFSGSSTIQSEWKDKSFIKLNKEDAGNPICRLALLAHLHDTADDIGIVKLGTTGIRSFLTRQNWEEPQLTTIEHIAPQNPPSSGTWDPNIYTPNSIVHSIGNLTLLPQEINSAAGNNDWATKCGLYQFIGAPTPVAVANLNTMYGSNLSSGTQKILTDSSRRHITHLTHITNNETDPSGTKKWDKGEIDARTQNIIDIAWERFSPWLF